MAHKRQRIDNGDGSTQSHKPDEFHITLANYGTIQLQKVSLQAFPSSLITITLLGDGIDDHELYVPIGRGHKSFPELIQDIYDLGVPRHLLAKGVEFDMFVKWLKYLGLATPGRGLSTESEAAKRVSFFVEAMLETMREEAHTLMRQPSSITAKEEAGRVTGVFMFRAPPQNPFAFEHGGNPYKLSWRIDDNGNTLVQLIQLDAGCCYDGRENLESIVVISAPDTDLVAEFKRGDMIYSPDRHGEPLMGGHKPSNQFLLLPGMSAYQGLFGDEDLDHACLLVVKSNTVGFCIHGTEEDFRDDMTVKPWRFELEESPEWALHA